MHHTKPKVAIPKAPAGLGADGRKLWREVASEFEIEDAGARATLRAACQAADRVAEARAIVAAEGMTTTDRFGQAKVHPAVMIERDARTQMLAALKQLHLDGEPARQPGRQPGVPFFPKMVKR